MEILARAVGRRKEAVAQVQMIRGSGQLIINTKPAHEYLQNDSCAILSVQAPFDIYKKTIFSPNSTESSNGSLPAATTMSTELNSIDTIVKVKGGGLKGQAEAIRLGVARALCTVAGANNQTLAWPAGQKEVNVDLTVASKENTVNTGLRKQLKDKGYLTQDSRVKERRKYGLKKARKASQYHKR
jgi:small subunit ribosomal protein S9